MYVGHGLLALAIVLLAAAHSDLGRRQTLAAGAIAAGFGTLPDVDLVYTVYAVVESGPTGVFPTTEHVWTESWVVHRTLTHSLLVGCVVVAIATAAAALFRGRTQPRRRDRPIAIATVLLGAGVLLTIALEADGGLGAVTMALFVAGAVAIAWVAVRWRVPLSWIALAATVGLLLHPPGDFWMGQSPALFYPAWTSPPVESVELAADPVLEFLAAVLIEIVLLAGAVLAVDVARDRPPLDAASAWSLLGVLQLAALWLFEAPTFRVAYRFSGLLVLLGAVAAFAAVVTDDRFVASWLDRTVTAAGAAAGAMLLGLFVYAIGHVLL